RGLEVDVGGRAEHGAQAALDPASENLLQAAAWRQSLRDIFEQRLVDVGVSVPERGLGRGPLEFADATGDDGQEITGVGNGRAQPPLAALLRLLAVEDVQGMAPSERELDVAS